jgi:hypothetical protein
LSRFPGADQHSEDVTGRKLQPWCSHESGAEAAGRQPLAEPCGLSLDEPGVDGRGHARVRVPEQPRYLNVGQPERERVRGERVAEVVQADRLLVVAEGDRPREVWKTSVSERMRSKPFAACRSR